MPRALSFSLFYFTFCTLIVLAHYYVWVRKVRDTALRKSARRVLTITLIAGCLFIPGAFTFWRMAPTLLPADVVVTAFAWLGLLFYLVLFLAGIDGVRAVACAARRAGRYVARRVPRERRGEASDSERVALTGAHVIASESARVNRRTFVARAVATAALAGTGGVSVAGARSARRDILTPEVIVRLSRLPRQLSGFRIALIADMHLGPSLRAPFTRAVVEKANALKPDLIAIAGDLVDGPVSALAGDVAPIAGLRARYGTYFVTGNHDFYSGVRPWMEFVSRLGIRVLNNERVSIGDQDSAGASFDLAGIHDLSGRNIDPLNSPNIERATAGRDAGRELILMAHQPAQIGDAVKAGAGLQLSGHTHGGQLWPFGAFVLLSQPYLHGLHQHTPQTQIYVSRGTGFWGPPMRVLAPAEITSIVLTP